MSPFENIGDVVANWIDDLINSDMAPPSPLPESIEWDGSRIVIEYEDEVSCRHEPGEYYEVRWYVYVYLRSHDSVQSVSRAQDRVYESIDLDVLNCNVRELLKAIRQVCRCVPADSPNQPDTPSLQDRYPQHPSFTEVV